MAVYLESASGKLPTAPLTDMLRTAFAQAWQDWVIFHNIFRHRVRWGGGSYVDFGTNDPEIISNTLFFVSATPTATDVGRQGDFVRGCPFLGGKPPKPPPRERLRRKTLRL